MKHFISCSFLCILIFFSNSICAYAKQSPVNTFELTLTNETNSTFYFSGVSGSNPTNNFQVEPSTLLPHQKAWVTATSSQAYDITGYIHFKNKSGDDNIFLILNYRKYHTGQSVFSMTNKKYYSVTNLLTPDPSSSPISSMYDAADVSLFKSN